MAAEVKCSHCKQPINRGFPSTFTNLNAIRHEAPCEHCGVMQSKHASFQFCSTPCFLAWVKENYERAVKVLNGEELPVDQPTPTG